MELDENGVGKCSVPMWIGGCPAGFCDKPAYGNKLKCREHYNAHTRRWQREDGIDCYAPYLACPIHGGPQKNDTHVS